MPDAIDTGALFFTALAAPAALERVQTELLPKIRTIATEIANTPHARVYFVGGGASLAAMFAAKYLLDRFTTVASDVMTGWQFLSRDPSALNGRAFLFAASYSGETPEVLAAKALAQDRGARVIAITNTPATPLASDGAEVLDFQSKAVFTAPLAIVYALCAEIMLAKGESVETARVLASELKNLPVTFAAQAARTMREGTGLAERAKDAKMIYVLGSGPLFGLAYKLSLSVVIENLWLDSAPVDAGEFYHGPIEAIPVDAPGVDRAFLHLVGTDASRAVSLRAIDFCTRRGAASLVFDAAGHPEFSELFSPFALFTPTEWLIMEIAHAKGHDVDERRYMGKIGARWGDYGVS